MSTINDTDQFLVQRGTTSHKQNAVNLMSTIQDTDLMLIQRGAESYKVTCLDVKDQLGGGGVSGEVNQPVVLKPKDGAGSGNTVYSLSDKITKVEGGGVITCETELIESVDAINYSNGVALTPGGASWYSTDTEANKAFDGDENTFASTPYSGNDSTDGFTITFTPGLTGEIVIGVYQAAGARYYSVNGNTRVNIGTDPSGKKDAINVGTFTSENPLNTLKLTSSNESGGQGSELFYVQQDGVILVDGPTTLTFPSDQGFNCFRPGDVVQSGLNLKGWKQLSGPGGIVDGTKTFDGNASTFAYTQLFASGVTFSWNTNAYQGETHNIRVRAALNGLGSIISHNAQITIAGTPQNLNVNTESIQTFNWSNVSDFAEARFAASGMINGGSYRIYDIAVDGVVITGADNGGTFEEVVNHSIVSINDSDPYTITVDGGEWNNSNQSEVWSSLWQEVAGLPSPINNPELGFDGNLSTVGSGSSTTRIDLSSYGFANQVVEWYNANGDKQGANLNDEADPTGSGASAVGWYTLGTVPADGRCEITLNGYGTSSYIAALRIGGRVLVDPVNDSQVWSSGADDNAKTNEGWEKSFDGSVAAPHTVAQDSSSTLLTLPEPVPFTTLEIYGNDINETGATRLYYSDTEYVTTWGSIHQGGGSGIDWGDVTSKFNSKPKVLYKIYVTNNNNADPSRIGGVRADGKLLQDKGIRDLGDNKLVKSTTYDTQLTVASSKDFASLSGGSWMTDGTGDPGPYSQTPYKLTTTDIESVDTVAWALDPDPSKTDLLLSNNNRTYTSAGGWRTGLSSEILSKTQESYFEFQLNNDSNNNGDHRLGILKDNGGYVPGDGAQASKPGDFDIIGYGNSVTGVGQPLQGRLLAKQNDVVKSQSVIFGDPFGGTSGQNDVIGFRVIPAENKVIAYKNGVEQGDLVAAALAALGATFDLTAGDWRIYAGKYESGSNVDLGSGGRITLTFPGDVSTNPDLQYFRAGDVVQSDWNQDQVWSTGLTTSSGWQSSDMPAGAFNGNVGDVFAQPNSATTIVFTPETPITYSTSVEVYAGGSDFVINGSISSSIDAGSWTKIEGSGTINTLEITPGGVPNLAAIRVDGLLLVDTGVENVNGTKVVSVDTANNQMVVDGGEWDDGSGVESFDILDQTYWDKGITDPSSWYNGDRFPSNMFDGLSTTNCSPIELTTFTADWTSGGGIAVTGALKIALFKHVAGECVINGLSLEDDPNWIKQSNQNDPNGSQGAADQVWINTSITVINSIQGSRPASGSKSGFLCKGLWDDNGWIVRAEVVPGDKNVEYQTKGGKGDIILADASNNTLRINNTGDSDNRWIAENKADVEFKIAGPSYVDSPLLTSHVELESSQFATTPAFDPNTGEPIDGLAKITWSLKPGNDAEYQLDAGTLNPYRPSGLQLNTTYTIKVKHTGARLGDSDWSLSTTFTTGASRTLNDHYMKQIKVLEEELREARSS